MNVDDFQFLDTVGIPTSGNSVYYDNGMRMHGTDTAFLFSSQVDGRPGLEMLQMLPLMQREGLPELVQASPLVLLWYNTPIIWQRTKHVVMRNVGRA